MDLHKGTIIQKQSHNTQIRGVSVHSEKKIVASGSFDCVKIWNLFTGKILRTIKTNKIFLIHDVSFINNGTIVIVQYGNGYCEAIEIKTGKILNSYIPQGRLIGIGKVIIRLDKLVFFNGFYSIQLWDFHSNNFRSFWQGNENLIVHFDVTNDGQSVVTSGNDNLVRLWDVNAEKPKLFYGHKALVKLVAINSTGSHIVSVCQDKVIKLWDVKCEKELASFTAEYTITTCHITNDGKTVIAGDEMGRYYLLALVK